MTTIENLNDQPRQQITVSLASGAQAVLTLEFKPQQAGWFYGLTIGTFTVNGRRLVASPNLLAQFQNRISFGIAVLTVDDSDPTSQTAFVDGTTTLILLDAGDVAIANAPAGSDPASLTLVTWAQLRAYLAEFFASPAGGDVSGPVVSVDGHLAVFDGTDGKTIKDGGAVPSVAGLAPIASPTFTGTPAAPTAATGTATTQLATTAFATLAAKTANVIDVTKAPYNADPTGVVDCSAAIDQAIYDALPKTGLDRIEMTNFGSGYTSAPAVSFTGMDTGATAPTATALMTKPGAWVNGQNYSTGDLVSYSGVDYRALNNMTPSTVAPPSDPTNWTVVVVQQVAGVTINTRGANIKVIGRYCSVTSGSPTVVGGGGGALTTSDLTVGMAADSEIFPAGTTISAITPGVSITLSANALSTDPYAPCAYGIPRVVFTGGAGSGAAAEAICGNGVKILFPPGVYSTGLGWYLMGNHNLTISGYGARIFVDGSNPTALNVWGFCRAVDIEGITVEHVSTVYGNYTGRGNGFGFKYQGSYGTLTDCQAWNSPNFGFGFGRGDNTTAGWARKNRAINCRAWQTCGDGFHAGNGVDGLDFLFPDSEGCGDDSIGLVSDYGTGKEGRNITVNGYALRKGGWRGIAILGVKNVQIGAGQIEDMRGFGIESATYSGATPDNIKISGPQLIGIGGAGAPGSVVGSRDAIKLRDITGGHLENFTVNGATGDGVNYDSLTDFNVGLGNILGVSGSTYNRGGSNTRTTQLWFDSGALKFIGGAGTPTTLATA